MTTYLDLGLNTEELRRNRNITRDSPRLNLFDPEDITYQAASDVGKILNENRCISLLFLLLPDSTKAFQNCNQVSTLEFLINEGVRLINF